MDRVIPWIILLLICCRCSSGQVKKEAAESILMRGQVREYPAADGKEGLPNIYLVTNWKSRSCVSFLLENGSDFTGYDGKILKVKATVRKMDSRWMGVIRVHEIMEEVRDEKGR